MTRREIMIDFTLPYEGKCIALSMIRSAMKAIEFSLNKHKQ